MTFMHGGRPGGPAAGAMTVAVTHTHRCERLAP